MTYSALSREVRHLNIVPFPGPGPAVRVDQNGAGLAVWRHDGCGLLFVERQDLTEVMLAFTPNPVVTATRRVIDGHSPSMARRTSASMSGETDRCCWCALCASRARS